MKSSTKRILNLLFLVSIFALVLYLGFKGNDPMKIIQEIKSLPIYWAFIFLSCWLLYMFSETLSMYTFFRFQNFKVPIPKLFKIVILGNYYSSITPAATGGQPMQVYYLKKCGVPVGISSSVLAVRFFIFQLCLLTLGTIFWLTNIDFVYNALGNKIWIIYIGYFFNSLTVLGVALLAINAKFVRIIILGIISLLHKLKIIKDKEKHITKAGKAIRHFEESVMMFRKDPLHLLLQFCITSVQFIFIFLTTVFIYRSFHLEGTSTMQIITMAALLFISACYTPLPGASGAQEGGFALFFAGIFPKSTLFSTLLIWRFFTYYTTLLLGFILSLFKFKGIEKEK